MTFTLAIVGRPNVGKSTLFNRLVGKRLALVDDTPGVTRDRREGMGRIAGLRFRLFDTAGLEDADAASLAGRMRDQTLRALDDADAILFLFDARAGITPMDQHFAQLLRGSGQTVILCANKCEGSAAEPGRLEAYDLGMGDPIPISAEHALGMEHLYEVLAPLIETHEATMDKRESPADWERRAGPVDLDEDGNPLDARQDDPTRPLQLAITGRPNVGKSTLINRLLGEDRLLTGPEAGITRDSIGVDYQHGERPIKLIDTAGLRRKSRVSGKLELLSAADTRRAIRFAQVVALVLDANSMLEKQDLTIAAHVVEEGRALLIVVNKWDIVADSQDSLQRLRDRLTKSLPQLRGVPVVTLSALTGRGIDRLMPAVLGAYDVWNRRISTAKLNQYLANLVEDHPPPLAQGRRIRLRYMTQAKTRPPTFVLFASQNEALPDSYRRYLINNLRDTFNLPGVPIRLHVRKGKNPYERKKK